MLKKMTDLELAETLAEQYQMLMTAQNNILALKAEIEKRKKTGQKEEIKP